MIIKDLKAFSEGSKKKMIVTLFTNPCFHSVCLFRMSNWFYRIHLAPIAKIIWYFNRMWYHVDIDYRAQLAGGLVIKHGLGLVIGHHVRSLGPVKLYQGVTLGGCGKVRLYEGEKIDQPILSENVIVYTDAKIFGPVVIGKNNHVRAGSLITEDIEDREV